MHGQQKNIFVIGDLVVDHTVFIRDTTGEHQQIEHERIYDVVRRLDIAGGAANSARILAVLNRGHTFLWGIIGASNWGTFQSILDNSQGLDGAPTNIEFRAVEDESGAKMNTITRLMLVKDPPNYLEVNIVTRYDDYGHVHVTQDKREAVTYYLERAHNKHGLNAILINDLDMNCLTPALAKKIADFAQEKGIPLFVDPKRDAIRSISARSPRLSRRCTPGGARFHCTRTCTCSWPMGA